MKTSSRKRIKQRFVIIIIIAVSPPADSAISRKLVRENLLRKITVYLDSGCAGCFVHTSYNSMPHWGARCGSGTASHRRVEEWRNQLILDRTENVRSEIEEKRNGTSPSSSSHHKESFVSQFHRRRKNAEEQKVQGGREDPSSFFLRPFSGISHTNFPSWHVPPLTLGFSVVAVLRTCAAFIYINIFSHS